MKQKNELGLIIGRFQHIHTGHERLIREGLSKCKKMLILVSDDEVRSKKDPYFAIYRAELIYRIFKKEIDSGIIKVDVLKTPSYIKKYVHSWGSYVLAYAKKITGMTVDAIVYGDDKNISKCFSQKDLVNIDTICVSRSFFNISATNIREILLEDKKEQWMLHVNRVIYDQYEYLKTKMIT